MEFLKIVSDDSSIEIMPLNKIFSIKVIMDKLYINGEDKHLKVENSEEFLNNYISFIAAAHVVCKSDNLSDVFDLDLKCLCIKNIDGYAKISVETVNDK